MADQNQKVQMIDQNKKIMPLHDTQLKLNPIQNIYGIAS